MRKQDLIDQVLDGRPPDVEQVTRPPLTVHESTAILRTLDLFRVTPVHTAIVVDEFGTLQGIVTRTDLLETVAGDLPKIDVPILVIQGDADRILPPDATSRKQAKMIKNCKFVELPGGPHGVLWTHADRVSSELVSFLA